MVPNCNESYAKAQLVLRGDTRLSENAVLCRAVWNDDEGR